MLTAALILFGVKGLPLLQEPQPVHAYELPDHMPVPTWVTSAPRQVREAYAFAAHNHELLQYIPCYCGCEQVHTDNSTCYFMRDEQGQIKDYESHAIG